MISRGSEWRRWEPHIHAPGTVLNDQYGGADPWEHYVTAIEGLTPTVEALAVTDYYVTDSYEELLRRKTAGRLPNVKLLFPNIELRLGVAAKTGFVNAHLLVSPEDPNHVAEIKRILTRFRFEAFGDRFDCTRGDLIKLGKCADPKVGDDGAALRHGATQFKVDFGQLREVFKQSAWAQQNILVAVAGAAGDGTSGVREAADATVRQEIERFADIVFASSAAQREFWLGQREATVEELRSRYGGCKPCLHGSDSHDPATIGKPVDNRYSWVKGDLHFDSLRQACIDPAGRAFVGQQPPQSAMPSQVISRVRIADARWAATPDVPLNAGLVAIIGARGSGKTALADVIAAGCDAISPSAWEADENASPSFIVRAQKLLGGSSATLSWGTGPDATRQLDGSDANGHMTFPRARYLSQQFVEELCSSKGVSDGLVSEIERVIFDAHAQQSGAGGSADFAELRDQETSRYRHARERETVAIADLSERIAVELEKESLVSSLKSQVLQKTQLVAGYNTDLSKMVVKGTEAQIKRHSQLTAAAQALRDNIRGFSNQRRTFVSLQDEVKSTRATRAPEWLRQAQARYPNSGLDGKQWDDFLLVYKGDVDASLAGYIEWADGKVKVLNGEALLPGDPNVPVIADDVDLTTLPLAPIEAEVARLEALFSADKTVRAQYSALSDRIAKENSALQALQARLIDAEGSAARRKELQKEREATYGQIFEAIVNEQQALAGLYAPLMARLGAASGTLTKLSFSVRRIADVERWGTRAEEELLDRRKTGPFQGRGALIEEVRRLLQTAWETGSATDVQVAMAAFIGKYQKTLLAYAKCDSSQPAEYRAWLKEFAHWLFDTSHMSVRYEISYDQVDIRKLSPGTRGIVLLLLYLALDESDDRPLIIDQPEENLDPKSVFDELVGLFIAAKSKRQVIIVTHNANLVINTDADQIIVAEAGAHDAGGLPTIRYTSGGLESAAVRKAVCDILEGGEVAFRERARRLRVRLDR